ncbi:MAG: ABC transporter permease [Acidobacteriaceae bacterium]|nr:ABC transporter permease [Acidobacteriaceae bacterium]
MWFRDLLQDLRFGIRMLKLNATFTTVAVLTLALGIGLNTAIFSVMNTVVLRPLPVRNANRLVHLRWSGPPPETVAYSGRQGEPLSQPIFERLRTERDIFSDLVAYANLGETVPVRHGAKPENVAAQLVSSNYFSGLGIGTECGRAFTLADEAAQQKLAVLSYAYWARSFDRSCKAIGQTLYIKTVPYTIVGVTIAGFHGIWEANDVWIPLEHDPLYSSPTWWAVHVIGRLQEGISEPGALSRLNPLFHRAIAEISSKPNPKREPCNLYFEAALGIAGLRNAFGEPLRALLALVGVILLMACSNVAMLLMARNAGRQREFSIRAALGSSRARLFRQLLAESLLLVLAGGALGWLFASPATDVIRAWADLDVSLAPDRTVLLFTMAVSIVATVVFALVPLYSEPRLPMATPLRTFSATAHPVRKLRGGRTIVSVQIALCLVLLAASGLLIRTLLNLERVDLGFRSSGLLVFEVQPPRAFESDAVGVRFYENLLERLRSLPGVESATLTANRLGRDANNTLALVDGTNLSGDQWEALLPWQVVGSDFVHTLGIRLLQGRNFNPADSASAAKVMLVNENFVKRYLHGGSALGHYVDFWESPKIHPGQFTIVGVVGNSKSWGVRDEDPMAYFPITQVLSVKGELFSWMTVEMRTVGKPLRSLPAVRGVLRRLNPDLTPIRPATQEQQFASSISQERLLARLAFCFGLMGVILVATGLYGTLAYAVSRRTAEIGVRIALGATRGQVLGIVVRQSLVAATIGIGIGLPLVFAAGRLFRSFLYGLTFEDPLTYLAACVGIALVCAAATWTPARRAAAIDPVVALRQE